MRPSFCVDLQTFSVHCGRTVCKVAYVWGRFRLGLTLDHTVFVSCICVVSRTTLDFARPTLSRLQLF